jgi:nitrogen regulatory protein PII
MKFISAILRPHQLDDVREWGKMSVYLLKQEQRLVGSLSG